MPWVQSVKVKSSRGNERWLLFVEFSIAIGIIVAVFGENYGLFATLLFVLCAGAFAFTGQSVWRMLTSLGDERLEIAHEPVDEVRNSLLREKKLLTEGLKELEADYAAGKVDDEDYAVLRSSAENRAIEVIKRIKDEDAKWLEAAKSAAGILQDDASQTTVEAKNVAPVAKKAASKAQRIVRADPSIFPDGTTQMKNNECITCGTSNPADARFCIGCGRLVEQGSH